MAKQHKILLWTARISGLIITLFFLSFFIGEGLSDIIHGKGKELLWFIPFTIPALAGYILAWFRPSCGGWLMIIGGIILASYFMLKCETIMVFIYGLPSLLIGACFLAGVNKELI